MRRIGPLPRRKDIAVVLTPRCLVVLEALAKAKVLRTRDVVVLGIFPSIPIARRRLGRLHHAGYCLGLVEAMHHDTRWVLTTQGAKEIGRA